MSLRWRITLVFVAMVGIILAGVGLRLRSAILRQTTDTLRQRLLAEARLSIVSAPEFPWDQSEALTAWTQELDQHLGARVTLVAADGTVVADSRYDAAEMENHADRPERLEAMRRGWGSAVRRSDTLGTEMLYGAVAAQHEGSQGEVLRLALPLTAVEAASQELRRALIVIFLVAAVLALVVVPWISKALTEPVERLVVAARRVARGDLDARVIGDVYGELGELTRVFNSAIERLSRLLQSSQSEAAQYAAILEQMSDAVVILDEQERVILANTAFGRLFGVRTETIAGEYVEQVALNYELTQLLTRALQQGSWQRDEVRLLHPEPRTLVGVANPITGNEGELMGAVGLLHDVTDLYRADQVRRDFVANASHELRTPAAGIKALAEALQAGALSDPDKGPDFVQQIVEATDRLTAILDDMLLLTRVERGQELLHREWVEVRQACAEALSHVEQRAASEGIDVQCTVSGEDRVYADSASLQTVLINLLDNAVKYTPRGGAVAVRGRQTPEGYELEVSDTGVGIPEADRERIFERFYRVDKARDRATGGTGLGLAIVKHSVEAHGGQVTVRSEEGEGSKFTVVFPPPRA
ncbi:MAG: PAS domain-containing protein [Armatimonadetes bacterium]|nr:PAS domain-containing protein [Armatimonadota bacterium]